MATNDASAREARDHSISITELFGDLIPYITQGLCKGLSGRSIVGISIQSTSDGTYKGVIRAVIDVGKPTEHGVVSYSTSDYPFGVLEYFENGLSYDDLDWRIDKYYQRDSQAPKIRPKGTTKVKLG